MDVKGLQLPAALVQMIHDGETAWMLKKLVDAYGDEFNTDDTLDLYGDLETIRQKMAELRRRFPPGYEKEANGDPNRPGFIPYILDFSQIVPFAYTGSGDTYWLDYRDNHQEP